jgi:hypothetical protein
MGHTYGAVTALPHLRGAVYHDYATLVFKHLGDGLPGQLMPRKPCSGSKTGRREEREARLSQADLSH